jgi:hypothetical protein
MGFPHPVLPVLLFLAGAFHLFQVIFTSVFLKTVSSETNESVKGRVEIDLSGPVRRGLIVFVLGSGLLVMVNAKDIAQGGRLAASLCLLLASVFAYRWHLQFFRFQKFLRLGAPRWAHVFLILGIGFTTFVYSYSAIVLFAQ